MIVRSGVLLLMLGLPVNGAASAERNQDNAAKVNQMQEDPSLVVKNRAVGHIQERDDTWRIWSNHGYLAGGGGVKTCVEDLFLFDQNFANNQLPGGRYVHEFFSEGTVLDNRFCLDVDAYYKKTEPANQTPAGQYRGLKRIQFTGGVFGMAAAMARFPQQEFTVVCLANNNHVNPMKLAEEISDLYLAADLKPQPEVPTREQPAEEIQLSAEDLQSKVGAYRADDGIIFQITYKDGTLWNNNSRGETYALKPLGPGRFQPTLYPDDTFVFQHTGSRGHYCLTLEWDGGSRLMRPVELTDPATLNLIEYVGEYFSSELATTYYIRAKDDALWLRLNGRRWERLDPTVPDEFVPHVRHWHENRRIGFRRNEANQVVGLSVGYWRVKGVDFDRMRPPQVDSSQEAPQKE